MIVTAGDVNVNRSFESAHIHILGPCATEGLASITAYLRGLVARDAYDRSFPTVQITKMLAFGGICAKQSGALGRLAMACRRWLGTAQLRHTWSKLARMVTGAERLAATSVFYARATSYRRRSGRLPAELFASLRSQLINEFRYTR